jgi:uncharacterized protein with PIN domain
LILGSLLFLAIRLRSRILGLILAGLLFHTSLDVIHIRQMHHLEQTLSEQAHSRCQECREQVDVLQVHTAYAPRNLLDRYNPKHFVMLCPQCHERAHAHNISTILGFL